LAGDGAAAGEADAVLAFLGIGHGSQVSGHWRPTVAAKEAAIKVQRCFKTVMQGLARGARAAISALSISTIHNEHAQ
jgi:hypothetical protein